MNGRDGTSALYDQIANLPEAEQLAMLRRPATQVDAELGERFARLSAATVATDAQQGFRHASLAIQVAWRLEGAVRRVRGPRAWLAVHAWLRIAAARRHLGQPLAALVAVDHALGKITRGKQEHRFRALAELELGLLYSLLEDLPKALEQVDKALQRFEKAGWPEMVAYVRLVWTCLWSCSLPAETIAEARASRFAVPIAEGVEALAPALVSELNELLDNRQPWPEVLATLEVDRPFFEGVAQHPRAGRPYERGE